MASKDIEHLLRLAVCYGSAKALTLSTVSLYAAGAMHTASSATDVRFRTIGSDEARAYWESGEPAGKAGAYAIQGRGGLFVEGLSGSYTGVVGLPVFETALLLRHAGIDVMTIPDDLANDDSDGMKQ